MTREELETLVRQATVETLSGMHMLAEHLNYSCYLTQNTDPTIAIWCETTSETVLYLRLNLKTTVTYGL